MKRSFLRCLRSVSLGLYHSYYQVRESALISSNKTAKSESTCAEVAWCYMTHRVPGCPCHRYNQYIQDSTKIKEVASILQDMCQKLTFLSWDHNWFAFFDFLKPSKWQTRTIPTTNTGEFQAGLLKLWHQYPWHCSTSRVSWSYALLGPSAARNWGLAPVGCNSTDRMDGQTWKKTAPQLNAGAPQRGRELNWGRIRK